MAAADRKTALSPAKSDSTLQGHQHCLRTAWCARHLRGFDMEEVFFFSTVFFSRCKGPRESRHPKLREISTPSSSNLKKRSFSRTLFSQITASTATGRWQHHEDLVKGRKHFFFFGHIIALPASCNKHCALYNYVSIHFKNELTHYILTP